MTSDVFSDWLTSLVTFFDKMFYYIDRCELWGFTREINSGISHVKYQFFSRRNYFFKTISVMVTSLVVLR